MKQGMIECSVCHSKLVNPSAKTVSRAYDRHRSKFSKKQRALNVLLVVGDCMLVGLQVISFILSKTTRVRFVILCMDLFGKSTFLFMLCSFFLKEVFSHIVSPAFICY